MVCISITTSKRISKTVRTDIVRILAGKHHDDRKNLEAVSVDDCNSNVGNEKSLER